MSRNLESMDQLESLKAKLETAINSSAVIENDYKSQISLLIRFIGKLSQGCKGIDLELDNKLANLRTSLNQSAPLSELETQVNVISQLLQQHSKINELHIKEMHAQFSSSGKTLQKAKGLPDDLRRELRTFLAESTQSKDALIQYIPLLSRLIEFYDIALKSKSDMPKGGLLGTIASKANVAASPEQLSSHIKATVKEIIALINQLELSDDLDKKLSDVRLTLDEELPIDDLMAKISAIFSLILMEFEQERETAKSFLSTLSDTLNIVQTAVKSTISTTDESQEKHAILNNQLNKQLTEMSDAVKKATLLEKMKPDINQKLQKIANTIVLKAAFENKQHKKVKSQLDEMKEKIDQLEAEGEVFKKRIEDQKVKSLQDPLTKLGNRGAFDEFFAQQMVRFHHTPFPLSIVVIDLDDFKRINDTYGHTAGDKTLQVIANTLTKKVGNDAFIGRYGGEEFVLVYSDLNETQLIAKLNVLKNTIARLPFKFKDNKVSITTSMGATHIKENDNVHIAFERADMALYQAKDKGKNQVIYS